MSTVDINGLERTEEAVPRPRSTSASDLPSWWKTRLGVAMWFVAEARPGWYWYDRKRITGAARHARVVSRLTRR